MLERLKTAITKPSQMFMYKDDSIGKSILYMFFVGFLFSIILVGTFFAAGSLILKSYDADIVDMGFIILMTLFFGGSIGIPISLFFGSLFWTAIIFIFSANPNKTFERFFKVTTYILGAAVVLMGIIIFVFCFILFLFAGTGSAEAAIVLILMISPVFFGLNIWQIYALVVAYRNANNY